MRVGPSVRVRKTSLLIRCGCVGLIVVGLAAVLQSHASASSTVRVQAAPRPSLGPISDPTMAAIRPLVRRGLRSVGLTGRSSTTAPRIAGAGIPQPSPIRRLLGPLPHQVIDNAALSTNWSGQLLSGGTYGGVEGAWTVPSVTPTTDAEYSATWVGVDGSESTSLIQTGTDQETAEGATSYFAWVELLPGSSLQIDAPVDPGDQMDATLNETSANVWTVTLDDDTQAWQYTDSFDYSTPGLSVEWIEEAPTVDGTLATLANFGSATFTGMATDYLSGQSSSVLDPIYMTNLDDSAILAYPEAFDAATNSFTDEYGMPPPVVTSVSPSEGASGVGTGVEIDGDFLSDAQRVDFGQSSAAFSANNDGSLGAIAPLTGSGTVDVTVTTPSGTSATSPADQYTYTAPVSPPPTTSPPTTSPPTTSPPTTSPPTTSNAGTTGHGYWLVGGDGGIFTFGSAQFHGSTGDLRLQRPVVGITPTRDDAGYWLVASDGGVFAFGDAGFHGSIPGLGYQPAGTPGAAHPLNAPVVGMVPSVDGGGYFMVAADGGVFAFGDAKFEGSCPGIGGCSGAAVSVMPDSSGRGYWVVTSTGGVYSFGDAPFYGAPGPRGTVTSSVRTPDGKGYWVLFSNGSVVPFGDAADLGGLPPGSAGGSEPASAIFATSDSGGYWIATAKGAVSPFGNAPDDGGVTGLRLNAPIIAAVGW
jgi:hypothetical protein